MPNDLRVSLLLKVSGLHGHTRRAWPEKLGYLNQPGPQPSLDLTFILTLCDLFFCHGAFVLHSRSVVWDAKCKWEERPLMTRRSTPLLRVIIHDSLVLVSSVPLLKKI